MKKLKLLFIGNSHTYYNDLPEIVREILASAGISASVTMLTEGGKGLEYHAPRKDTRFNILYGGYDYVIMQHKATNFDRVPLLEGGCAINRLVREAGAKPLLYMIWAHRDRRSLQNTITEGYRELAAEIGAPLAPAGEVWKSLLRTDKTLPLYREDGNHATPLGSYIAAMSIVYAITGRCRAIATPEGGEPHTRLGIAPELANKISRTALRVTKKQNSTL